MSEPRQYAVTVRLEQPVVHDYIYGMTAPSTEEFIHSAHTVIETANGSLEVYVLERQPGGARTERLVASYAKGVWLHVREVK